MTTQNKIEKYKCEFEDYEEIFKASEIVCPYCFHVQNDVFEITGAYEDGDHDMNCQECNKNFCFSTDIETYYTCYKDEDE